jgi:hypothetical protein
MSWLTTCLRPLLCFKAFGTSKFSVISIEGQKTHELASQGTSRCVFIQLINNLLGGWPGFFVSNDN